LNRDFGVLSVRLSGRYCWRGERLWNSENYSAASLRQCRRSRGLTQAQLAEATDLSLEMIGRLERGLTAPSFETIAGLSSALRIAPAELFGAEPTDMEGERREIMGRINHLLASASDAEVERAERVLNALIKDE
jgi:transcriptional regulator with XRE-family HTH domain